MTAASHPSHPPYPPHPLHPVQARVRLCRVRLDFGRRQVVATHVYSLSGDEAADMAYIAASFAGVQGRRPVGASPIVLLKSPPARGAAPSSPQSHGELPRV